MFGIGGCEEVWSSIFWTERREDVSTCLSFVKISWTFAIRHFTSSYVIQTPTLSPWRCRDDEREPWVYWSFGRISPWDGRTPVGFGCCCPAPFLPSPSLNQSAPYSLRRPSCNWWVWHWKYRGKRRLGIDITNSVYTPFSSERKTFETVLTSRNCVACKTVHTRTHHILTDTQYTRTCC